MIADPPLATAGLAGRRRVRSSRVRAPGRRRGSGGLGLGLTPAEHPSTTVNERPPSPPAAHAPYHAAAGPAFGAAPDVALADVAIGSAGNMYIPAASLGSRRTLLPLPFEHRAGCRRESPHCEGALTRLTTPWPAWPQHSM